MKKLILAVLAASVLATPVLADPYDHHDNGGRYEQRHDDRGDRGDHRDHRGYDQRRDYRADRGYDRGYNAGYRQWQRGDRFDSRYARDYRVVDYRAYHLRPAPRGYRWVRSGNDAVMVGITTGLIAAVMANAIH